MNTFRKAFGRDKLPNTKTRTFSNMFKGISKGYLRYYYNAKSDFLKGNYSSALININKTIDNSDVNDWKHFAFKAKLLEDLRRYNEAIDEYQIAIEYSINDINVYALYHQIGICYLFSGNNEKANDFYTYAIELKKQHCNSEFNLDIEGMDDGILLGLPFERLYNNRGNALKNLNKLNEALEDCNRALSYDNQYSNTYLLMSQIYNQAEHVNKSIEMLEISAQLGNQYAIKTLKQIK